MHEGLTVADLDNIDARINHHKVTDKASPAPDATVRLTFAECNRLVAMARRGMAHMAPEQFANRMREAVTSDEESQHSVADGLMTSLLRELGYGEGVDVFEKMDKWYA